ncbi:hypothetical protein CTA1_12397, partial [Colletotrichum tanaceti]
MAEESSNDPENVEDAPASSAAGTAAAAAADDVEMEGVAEGDNANANANEGDLPFAEGGENDPVEPRTTFVSYLSSPVVTLLVGQGESEAIVTAHQALLVQSPFFKEACAQFSDDGS